MVSVQETNFGLGNLWSQTIGDPRICVAVLDGPVDRTHPCFAGADLTQVETVVDGAVGNDAASQHGTQVASVIFGRHGSSVWGIAPGCRGLIVPIYRTTQGQAMICSQLDLARAINLAMTHGAHVINISGGELTNGGEAEPLLAQAIARCTASGILIVAAAGNDGCRCLHVPAAVPSVLAVGAMDKYGAALGFSNWGDTYLQQGIVACGQKILGAVPGGGTAERSGTSFTTPVISGVVALLLSVQLMRGEKPDPHKVRAALLDTTDRCDAKNSEDCRRLLVGRLNIPAALARIQQISISSLVTVQVVQAPDSGEIETTSGQASRKVGPADTTAKDRPTDNGVYSPCIGISVTATPGKLGVAPADNSNPLPKQKENTMTEAQPTVISKSKPDFDDHFEARAAVSAGVLASEHSEMPVVDSEFAGSPSPIESPVSYAGPQVTASGVSPSACGCGDKSTPPALVYALGQVGYDFESETKRDSFLQQSGQNLQDPSTLLEYLNGDPASAASIIWTLSVDATVVYAIQPYGPYAAGGYDRLREFLSGQLTEGVERVSIPGRTVGSIRLLNGQTVPVIFPEVRGMYSWSTAALLSEVEDDAVKAGIQNFLERIYYEIRNLGLTPQERAQNFAATNAFQLEFVYRDAIKAGLRLDSIDVETSPICRPGSDCHDVKLTFFHPTKRLEIAKTVYRFTVDVSGLIPVTVGKVRHWEIN